MSSYYDIYTIQIIRKMMIGHVAIIKTQLARVLHAHTLVVDRVLGLPRVPASDYGN